MSSHACRVTTPLQSNSISDRKAYSLPKQLFAYEVMSLLEQPQRCSKSMPQFSVLSRHRFVHCCHRCSNEKNTASILKLFCLFKIVSGTQFTDAQHCGRNSKRSIGIDVTTIVTTRQFSWPEFRTNPIFY